MDCSGYGGGRSQIDVIGPPSSRKSCQADLKLDMGLQDDGDESNGGQSRRQWW